MRILLDTSEFLWFISGHSALPAKTRDEIRKPENEVFLSVVSLWEIIVKTHSAVFRFRSNLTFTFRNNAICTTSNL